MKRLILLLLCLTLAVSLLNSGLYGDPSLTALFQFLFFSCLVSSFIFVFVGLKKNTQLKLPYYLILFIILTTYVVAQGIAVENFGLSRYYWLCCCLFLVSVYLFTKVTNQPTVKLSIKAQIYLIITIVAFLEALVVLLQYAGAIPVPTKFFRCTGTWLNPNITAMFLVFSMFAINHIIQLAGSGCKRLVLQAIWGAVLLSILLLFSRTAIVITLVILLNAHFHFLYRVFSHIGQASKKNFAVLLCIVVSLVMITLTVFMKERSTAGRLQIWNKAIGLIMQKPLFGYGFDQFEREINLFAADEKGSATEHVSIAYNDFLEIGVEGGIVAMLLWISFYLLLSSYCIKRRITGMYAILAAFFIVQITNFGFQAIPAFVLFLLYIAVETGTLPAQAYAEPTKNPRLWISKTALSFSLVIAVACLIATFQLSSAFYKKNEIVKNTHNTKRLNDLLKLSEDLQSFASFQEAMGDLQLETHNYDLALTHYLNATQKSSSPVLYSKCGYCYQMLGEFAASQQYYLLVQRMEPEKLGPHLSLLRMFRHKNDTANILAQAQLIVNKPVRIVSSRAVEIKKYADSVIKAFNYKPVVNAF